MRITAYAASDVGRHREINEDNLYSGDIVFAVADGMGGHAAGEVASEAALEPVRELDGSAYDDAKSATDALRAAVQAANRTVVSQAKADPNLAGMGTTLTAVLLRGDRLHLAHVGDSRAYLLREPEGISQLTTDHTLVEQLVQDGRLSRDEVSSHPQRSVITRAIGVDVNVEVDTLEQVLQPGDQVLLCSDGLSGPVSDEDMADLLLTEPDGQRAVEALIQAANDAGGPDNITVVLLRVEDDGTGGVLLDSEERAGDDTGDLAEAAPTAALADPPKSIPIRTRPESEHHDWAKDMSRYGDRQGVEGTGLEQRSRSKRILAIVAGVIVILAILLVGGYLVLSRAYFIGATEADTVGIFSGINGEVAGVALYRQVEDTGLAISSLPAFQQARVEEGITQESRENAEKTVAQYREELEDAQAEQAEPARRKRKPSDSATSAP